MYRAILMVFILLFTTTTAMAQAGLYKRFSNIGLKQSDIDMLTATAEGMYVTSPAKSGATKQWENPETGARGQVETLDVGGNCVTVRHIIRVAGADESAAFASRRCQAADGSWQLSTE